MVILRQLGRLILAGLLLLLMAGMSFAQDTQVTPSLPSDPLKTTERQNARRQTLDEEQVATERLRQEVRALNADLPAKLQALQVGQLTETLVEQAKIDTSSMQLKLEDVQTSIASAERQIKTLEQAVRELEAKEQLLKNPAKDAAEGASRVEQLELTRQALKQQRADLELEKQNLTNLRDRLELVTQRLTLAQQWQSGVEEVYRLQQAQSRREAQEDLSKRLEKEQQAYLEQAAEWRSRLEQQGEKLSEAQRLLMETRIQSAEAKAKLIQLDLYLSKAVNELAGWEALAAKTDVEPKLLQDGLKQLGGLRSELQDGDTLLQRRVELFTQQQQVIERREGLTDTDNRFRNEEAKVVSDLLEDLHKHRDRLQQLLSRSNEIQNRLDAAYKERLSQDLLARELLLGTTEEWQALLTSLMDSPGVLLHQIRLSMESAGKAMVNASALQWVGLVALELGLVGLVVLVWRYLLRTQGKDENGQDDSFLVQVVRTLLRLLRKNLWSILLATTLLPAVWLFQVPQPGLGIIMTLVLLWVGNKMLVNLAWLLLASPRLPPGQQRPRLYRQVFWTLLFSGCLIAITLLAHLSALPKTVSSVFDRLFMGYWLVLFLPLLQVRRYMLELLAGHYAGQFWFMSLRLISLLLPLSLLVASILGLAGYLNLAWVVAWDLLILVSVLVGWLIVRGLFNDLVIVLKNYAVSHSDYGLLWTQDIINPLHKILDLVLVLGAWATLFGIYGWYGEAAFIADVWTFLERPLFTVGGAGISLWGILVTGVTFLVVIWFGQWSRAITYRWIFSHTTDLGVRHSLSVFTQYFVVLIGVLLVLRILGLDLTTLTIFAGAVGVGIGFGMQNIANNFISGLLLLIERPLRSGDTVQIGEYTGKIAGIGIRSMILKTWDEQEVIIPNSEVISKPFTNWTHTDYIMRTVLIIGVSYKADPHQVKALLDQILTNHPDVLQDPAWAVLLWEFAESAVNFRIQYYTDLSQSSLLQVRSSILFAIWDSLKQAGVEIPYPQRDLYIKEWPQGLAAVPPVETPAAPVPPSKAVPGVSGAR